MGLADRYRVISLDHRGHGDSDRPGAYAITQFIADLRSVILELEIEHPVLFGHSLGSIVTSWYAGTWPDEPAALVMLEGLGPPARFGEHTEQGRRAIAAAQIEVLLADPSRPPLADLDAARGRLRAAHPALPEERIEQLAVHGTEPHPDGGLRWKWDPQVIQWSSTFSRDQLEDRWRSVHCPTLILTGGEAWERWWKPTTARRPGPAFDGPMPDHERDRRLACFADVEHHVLPAGHMVHFDTPDEVIRLTRAFLQDRGTAP